MKRISTCLLLSSALMAVSHAQPAQHPLDPLSQTEMQQMVQILNASGKLNERCRFPMVTLHEPPKAAVHSFKPGGPIQRKAFVVVLDRQHDKVFEAVVDLVGNKVESYLEKPGQHPGVLIEEFESPSAYVRKDPRWQEAMKKRGINDFENVQIDVWATGILGADDYRKGTRLLRGLSFYRPKGQTNPYYRPIEGVIVVIDPKLEQVIRVEDTGAIAPVKKGPDGELEASFIAKELGGLRPPLKPIVYSQPEGSSIGVQGQLVTWDRWRFRYTMHPREGLVLQTLEYQDRDRWRSVLYRGSLSEMVVPYGDNAPNWYWRNAFDLGEYGVGRLATTLRPGYEVPKHAIMLDSIFADDKGAPYLQKANVAVYEKDAGILWKHQDFESQSDQTRPARNLYLTYVATVGNYDYALSWVLGQDGSVGVEAQLTGIVLAKGVKSVQSKGLDAQGDERFGRLVDQNVVAPNHQHFFNFRLDMDVDGVNNSLVETNNQSLPPGPENPAGNAFSRVVTPLRTEKEAARDMNMHSQRSWMVINPSVKNSLNQSTGYSLMHGENSVPYLHPDAPVYKRAGFLKHHMWGSRYRSSELYPSGDYPNQSQNSSGFPGWQEDDESLENQDVVLWYVCGVTHNPRPEEWPVMPSHKIGFKLLPNGFFSRNPSMDVPPPKETP